MFEDMALVKRDLVCRLGNAVVWQCSRSRAEAARALGGVLSFELDRRPALRVGGGEIFEEPSQSQSEGAALHASARYQSAENRSGSATPCH